MFCFPNSDHVMFSTEFSGVPSRGLKWKKKHKSQKVYICALCQFYRNKQEQFCSIPTSVLGSLLLPPPGVKEKRRDPGNKVGRPRQLASVGRHSIGSGKGENLSPENKKVNGNSPWGLRGTDHLMFTQ